MSLLAGLRNAGMAESFFAFQQVAARPESGLERLRNSGKIASSLASQRPPSNAATCWDCEEILDRLA
jgi:hypothetical protein